MKTLVNSFFCLVLAAALVLAFSQSPAAGEPASVRIGVCLSLTGEFGPSGRKALAGVKLRLEDFNNRAEENGYTLELVVRDDRSNPETAAANVADLAENEKVPAIIGPLSTNLMLGMLEPARRHRVVLVSPSVTSPQIGRNGDWAFRLLFDDEFQGVALARFLRDKLGIERVASIVNRRLAYAVSVEQAFKTEFENKGGTMMAEEFYEWVADMNSAVDFHPILQRIAGLDPQMVLLPNNSADVVEIVSQSLGFDMQGKFFGGDTWLHEHILMSAGNNIEGALYVSGIDYKSQSPEMRRFMALYDESHDPAAQPSSVLGFDCLSLIIEAMENGHDAESIKEGLYGIRDFPLATGRITIDRERGSEKSAYIHKIVRTESGFAAVVADVVEP